MRHNDYMVGNACKMCGKPIMFSRSWVGRMKNSKSTRENPMVPTCLHVKRKAPEADE